MAPTTEEKQGTDKTSSSDNGSNTGKKSRKEIFLDVVKVVLGIFKKDTAAAKFTKEFGEDFRMMIRAKPRHFVAIAVKHKYSAMDKIMLMHFYYHAKINKIKDIKHYEN